MTLEDIQKSIADEAKSQADKIISDAEKKVAQINNEWAKKIEARQEEIVSSAKKKAGQKVQQAQFKLQSRAQTEILAEKHRVLNQVYKAALAQLNSLENNDYVELMAKLITGLPDVNGEIFSAEGKEALLKKAIKNSGRKFDLAKETIKTSGGFVFKSKELEIDQTFPALIDIAKEETVIEVSSQLFNQQS